MFVFYEFLGTVNALSLRGVNDWQMAAVTVQNQKQVTFGITLYTTKRRYVPTVAFDEITVSYREFTTFPFYTFIYSLYMYIQSRR